MWRLNQDDLRNLILNSSTPVQWEQIVYRGKGPGFISHHTCYVVGEKMILIGGLQGEIQNTVTYAFDIASNTWEIVKDIGD